MLGLRAVVPRRKKKQSRVESQIPRLKYHRYKPLGFTFRKMALKFRTYLMINSQFIAAKKTGGYKASKKYF